MKFTITPLDPDGAEATSPEMTASVGEVLFHEMRRCFFGVIPPFDVLNVTLRAGEIVDTENRCFHWTPFELSPSEYEALKKEVLAHPQWRTEVDESFIGTVEEWSHWALVRAVSK